MTVGRKVISTLGIIRKKVEIIIIVIFIKNQCSKETGKSSFCRLKKEIVELEKVQ